MRMLTLECSFGVSGEILSLRISWMKLIEMNRKAMLAASSKYSSNSLPFVINMLLLTSVIFYQALTDVKSRENRNLLFLAPIAWIVFYFMDFVEYQALIKEFLAPVSQETGNVAKVAAVRGTRGTLGTLA